MVSMRSFPERAVQVRALAWDIVLCSWARHLTLTVPLSTQEYKWVPANCWGNPTNCGEMTCNGLASRPGGVEILLAASCYGNRDKLQQHEPVLAPRLHLFFTPGTHTAIEVLPIQEQRENLRLGLWQRRSCSFAFLFLMVVLNLCQSCRHNLILHVPQLVHVR